MTAPCVNLDDARVLADLRRHVGQCRARLAQLAGGVVEVASQGSRVIDSEGNEYLNCGGYGVFILGHRHPRVVEAVRRQLDAHPLGTRLFAEPRLAEAAAKLASVAPGPLEIAHFVTSGAEAVETAIKLGRTHGKSRLVSMRGGFHGKTMGALSVTARAMDQDPFRPLLPWVTHVPFGDAAALEAVLAVADDCCVIVEPIQGAAGVILPPDGYLREVEGLCRCHDAFFVLDEIQTGLGRLGTWWGADREGVVPDVLLVGKGLSGGVMPVAAAVATPEAYAALDREPVLHSSTFGGAPLAMAAAHAAITAIEDEDIVGRAQALGERLLAALRGMAGGPPIVEVRGRGLLIGIECESGHAACDLTLELLERGVVVSHALNDHSVVRLTPPAIMSEADIAWLLQAMHDSLEVLALRHAPAIVEAA